VLTLYSYICGILSTFYRWLLCCDVWGFRLELDFARSARVYINWLWLEFESDELSQIKYLLKYGWAENLLLLNFGFTLHVARNNYTANFGRATTAASYNFMSFYVLSLLERQTERVYPKKVQTAVTFDQNQIH